MPELTQLYTELKVSKPKNYKAMDCDSNVLRFIKYLKDRNLSPEILDNLHVIYFYNAGNGASLYGRMSYSLHVNLMFFDEKTRDWYLLDYDIERIIKDQKLDKPILVSEFLQTAFCGPSAKFPIQLAVDGGNYYPLTSFQQVMVFRLNEYEETCLKDEGNIIRADYFTHEQKISLWALYKESNISFNNLYEFITFLEERTVSLEPLRAYYQNKPFEEMTESAFANTPSRLDRSALLNLQHFLFSAPAKSASLESSELRDKEKAGRLHMPGQSMFFSHHSSMRQEGGCVSEESTICRRVPSRVPKVSFM